jgi:aspartyl-tRNA(Asn)/glutamyl-tRNA(Gln) amidotransferase subunit C
MEILTSIELAKIAKLSGLALTPEEETRFLCELRQILDYTKHLNALSVTETLQSNKPINVFREDKIRPSEANTILQNAQAVSEDEYFVVPKVLK